MTLPIGGIVAWPTSAAIPADYLPCDGSSISSGTYPALFALIGGTTPDLTAKMIAGAGGSLSPNDQGGSNTWAPVGHVHAPHDATTQASSHSHEGPGSSGPNTNSFLIASDSGSASTARGTGFTAVSNYDGNTHSHPIPGTISTDGGHVHNSDGNYASDTPTGIPSLPFWYATQFIVRAA